MYSVDFNSETRNFSVKDIIKGPWGSKLIIPSDGELCKAVIPQVAFTAYKYTFDSYYLQPVDKSNRMKQMYNAILKMHPEVPVLEATGFNNACYIKDLDKIIDQIPEEERDFQIKVFAMQYGLDEKKFRKSIGPHLILMGKLFQSPQTLAHEFGHYQCHIGKGVPGGAESHDRRTTVGFKQFLSNQFIDLALAGSLIFKNKTARLVSQLSLLIAQLIKSLTSKPILESEMAASKTAMLDLEAAGATQEELDYYWKDLQEAYETYNLYYYKRPMRKAMLTGALVAIDQLGNVNKK